MIRPRRLKPGDAIGLTSLASPVAAQRPRRFARGVAELERRGFSVRVAPHATAARGHVAGTVAERLADLHALVADEAVTAIMSVIGGYNSNDVLEQLDYDLVAANPKIFVGYSDLTAVQTAIWQRVGLSTMYGPALLPQFGEYGGVHDYTWASFTRTLMEAEPAGELTPSPEWTAEVLLWDKEDDRSRVMRPNQGPRVVRVGSGEGWLAPTNLTTLLALAGTPFWPELAGAVLCIEADEEETAATVARRLRHLRQIGVFVRINALVVGRMPPAVGLAAADLDRLLLEATADTPFPIAVDFDFGHTDPMFVLPWGLRASLDARGAARLILLEAAVQ
jgi:muramoyltetrapeptide carboxypeptidase